MGFFVRRRCRDNLRDQGFLASDVTNQFNLDGTPDHNILEIGYGLMYSS